MYLTPPVPSSIPGNTFSSPRTIVLHSTAIISILPPTNQQDIELCEVKSDPRPVHYYRHECWNVHLKLEKWKKKTLFIVPNYVRYYKIIEMLKQFKIITPFPTCFASRRNHHQGAVLCLAKTTKYVKFYSHQLMHFFIKPCISLLSYIKIT